MQDLIRELCEALGLPAANVQVTGVGSLASAFRVSDLAAASVALAGVALRALRDDDPESIAVTVDRAQASHWFSLSIRPDGWELPALWDSIAGDYRSADGWIRLHTNAPHHRAAALNVLNAAEDRAQVAAAVARHRAAELENEIVGAGGAAAAMRTFEEWAAHPQGRAVQAEPLICASTTGAAALWSPDGPPERPLARVRVLDLTRVLAGPVATRLLAGWGAQVLRIDPPGWDEPAVIPEMTLGKRSARLDLTDRYQREQFEALLVAADVVVHGYRSDALAGLGYTSEKLDELKPGIVDVALDAYGWTGPWATRRGFDSLVQMSTGIAAHGMAVFKADRPTPLPVQALDHATGYLLAAAALRGLVTRRVEQRGTRWRLSLARTAKLLIDAGTPGRDSEPPAEAVIADDVEQTSWGPARRLVTPLNVEGAPLHWDLPARRLGSEQARW